MSTLGLTNFGDLSAPIQPLSDFDDILGNTSSPTMGGGLIGVSPLQNGTYSGNSVAARVNLAGHPTQTNTIVGFGAFNDASLTGTVGYHCTTFGVQTLAANSASTNAGGNNTAMGFGVLSNNVEGSGNSAFGSLALNALPGAAGGVGFSHNNAFGYRVLTSLTNGVQNNCFGFEVALNLAVGNNNHGFGESALFSLVTGSGNHANGFQALYSKTTGDFAHAYGYDSCFSETSGSNNTGLGYRTLFSNGVASNNVVIGFNALNGAEPGDSNVVIGFESAYALNQHATGGVGGTLNTAVGYWALRRISGGSSNSVFGQQSGAFINNGANNVCVGDSSGFGITDANGNTVVGSGSLSGGTGHVGDNNTVIGSGAFTSPGVWSNSVAIGSGAQPSGSNQVVIGNNAITTNQLFGSLSITAGAGSGNVTITGNFSSSAGGVSVPGNITTTTGNLSGVGLNLTGNIVAVPAASATPATNGQMTFELTSNTTLKIKVKGSDGVVRSASLTLA